MEKIVVGSGLLRMEKRKWCYGHMPKIQKEIAYRYKDHALYRYRLSVPSDIVESTGWAEGTEVIFKVVEGDKTPEIIIAPKANTDK
jgi:hypothetical protein